MCHTQALLTRGDFWLDRLSLMPELCRSANSWRLNLACNFFIFIIYSGYQSACSNSEKKDIFQVDSVVCEILVPYCPMSPRSFHHHTTLYNNRQEQGKTPESVETTCKIKTEALTAEAQWDEHASAECLLCSGATVLNHHNSTALSYCSQH